MVAWFSWGTSISVDWHITYSEFIHHTPKLLINLLRGSVWILLYPLLPFLIPFSCHLPSIPFSMNCLQMRCVVIYSNRVLFYIDSTLLKEAAKLLGWSVTNVKVRTFRVRKKLQKLLSGVLDSTDIAAR